MKRIVLLLVSLCFFSISIAQETENQIEWIYQYDVALELAKKQNRLVIVDFQASWCESCKYMDQEVWSRETIVALMQDFVPLRVNIETGNRVVLKYNLEAFPALLVLDKNGYSYFTWRDFSDEGTLMDILLSFPTSTRRIDAVIAKLSKDTRNPRLNFDLGKVYQEEAEWLAGPGHRIFIQKSNYFLKKGRKKTNQAILNEELELRIVLNKIYSKSYSIEKIGKDITKLEPVDPKNQALFNYVKAVAYLAYGEKENARKAYTALSSMEGEVAENFTQRLLKLATKIQDYYYIE